MGIRTRATGAAGRGDRNGTAVAAQTGASAPWLRSPDGLANDADRRSLRLRAPERVRQEQGSAATDHHGSVVTVQAPSEAARAPHLVEWFRRSSRPTFFLRPDSLEVYDLNPSARAMLETRGPLFLVGNRLRLAGGRQAMEKFQTFLAGLATRPRAHAVRHGDDHVVLKVKPLPNTGFVAIQVFPAQGTPASGGDALWADTRAAFGLTPAEDRLLKMMVEGANAEELAIRLGISIETVRTHVRRAYAKLGVVNREQLFATLSAFRLRL